MTVSRLPRMRGGLRGRRHDGHGLRADAADTARRREANRRGGSLRGASLRGASLRGAAALLAGMLSLGILVGCAPSDPTPTPTPTGFAPQEEAFAAAEATYRAYVDALNQVDLANPATFEEVYRWTTGEANAEARESFSQMHADGWTVSGESQVTLVELASANAADTSEIDLAVCLDVSDVDVRDASGATLVSPSRGTVQTMRIVLTSSAGTSTSLTISSIEGRDGEPACAN